MQKRLGALLILAAITLSACGMSEASGEQVRYGYVAEYDAAADTLLLDEVEWLTPDDAQRLSQLGMTLKSGEKFRIHDEKQATEKLKTADDLVFYHYVAGGVAAGTADGYGENSTATFNTERNNNNSSDNMLLPEGRINEMSRAMSGDKEDVQALLDKAEEQLTDRQLDPEENVEMRNQGSGYQLNGDSDAAETADDYRLIDYPFAGKNWQIRDARLNSGQIGSYVQQQNNQRGALCRIYLRDGVVVAVEELQPGDFNG